MTLLEAIKDRHSIRAYKDQPLADDVVKVLEEQIAFLNKEGELHMQLILNEPKAFKGPIAKYGMFRNANNYIVVAGKKADDLDERVGYYGEHLVLLAQTLGLNTCWVGLSYSKEPGTYVLDEGEKIACYIAIGYRKSRTCPIYFLYLFINICRRIILNKFTFKVPVVIVVPPLSQ